MPPPDAGPPLTKQVLPGAKPAAAAKHPGAAKDQAALGFVGAGNYATSMLLPHLAGVIVEAVTAAIRAAAGTGTAG